MKVRLEIARAIYAPPLCIPTWLVNDGPDAADSNVQGFAGLKAHGEDSGRLLGGA